MKQSVTYRSVWGLLLIALAFSPLYSQAQRFIPKKVKLNNVAGFQSATNYTVVGDSGTIYTTLNAGQTWVKDTINTTYNIKQITTRFSANIWARLAVGDSGLFAFSLGAAGQNYNWSVVNLNTKRTLRAVSGGGAWYGGDGVMAGDSGTVYFWHRQNNNNNVFNFSRPEWGNIYSMHVRRYETSSGGLRRQDLIFGGDSGRVYTMFRDSSQVTNRVDSTFIFRTINFDSLTTGRIITIAPGNTPGGRLIAYANNGDILNIIPQGQGLYRATLVTNTPQTVNGLACTRLPQLNAAAFASQAWNVRWNVMIGNNGNIQGAYTDGGDGLRSLHCGNSGTNLNLNGIYGYQPSGLPPQFIIVGDSGVVINTARAAAVPAIIEPLGPTAFCKNAGSVILRDTLAGNYTYQWFRNGVAIPNATQATFTATDSGSYFVRRRTFDFLRTLNNNGQWTTFNGPDTNSNAIQLRFLPAPARPSIVANTATEIQANGSTGAVSYRWIFNGSFLAEDTSNRLLPAATGRYRVVAIGPNGCPSDTSAAYEFQVCAEIPTALNFVRDTTICRGSNILLRYTPPTELTGLQYQWFRSGTPVGTGGQSNLQTVVDTGTFVLRIIKSNCEVFTNTIRISVSELPATPTITVNGNLALCSGDSVTLEAPEGFAAFRWTQGLTNVIGNQRTITLSAATAGVRLQTINESGCLSAQSQPVSVTLSQRPNAPTITVTGGTLRCEGERVTLTAPNANAYLWSTGATTRTIEATTTGSYTVSIRTTTTGCFSLASAPVELTFNPVPAVPTIVRRNDTLEATGSVASAYQWFRNGTIINGATEAIYVTTLAGNYTVRAIEANCQSAASAPFNVTSLQAAQAQFNLRVFPNPSAGNFTVVGNTRINKLEVIDPTGKVVYQQTDLATETDGLLKLNLQGILQRGTYLLRVSDQNNASAIMKVVIE